MQGKTSNGNEDTTSPKVSWNRSPSHSGNGWGSKSSREFSSDVSWSQKRISHDRKEVSYVKANTISANMTSHSGHGCKLDDILKRTRSDSFSKACKNTESSANALVFKISNDTTSVITSVIRKWYHSDSAFSNSLARNATSNTSKMNYFTKSIPNDSLMKKRVDNQVFSGMKPQKSNIIKNNILARESNKSEIELETETDQDSSGRHAISNSISKNKSVKGINSSSKFFGCKSVLDYKPTILPVSRPRHLHDLVAPPIPDDENILCSRKEILAKLCGGKKSLSDCIQVSHVVTFDDSPLKSPLCQTLQVISYCNLDSLNDFIQYSKDIRDDNNNLRLRIFRCTLGVKQTTCLKDIPNSNGFKQKMYDLRKRNLGMILHKDKYHRFTIISPLQNNEANHINGFAWLYIGDMIQAESLLSDQVD